MSWSRQIKLLVALEIVLVTYTAWTTLISLLFKQSADYRLFFISLSLIFLMQYIYVRKKNQYLVMIIPSLVSIPFLLFLFDGASVIFNLIFVIVNILINLKFEELSIEYEEYKLNIKQGVVVLGVMAIVSLWMEKSTADYIYRFIVNYIIAAVVLLRESRAYCYKIKKDDSDLEKTKPIGTIKRLVIDIFFKYSIVIISTLILTTDWILGQSIGIINAFSRAASFIIGVILDILKVIVGPILVFLVDRLSEGFLKSSFSTRLEDLNEGLRRIFKNTDLERGGANASDVNFAVNTFKAIALLIIALFIIDAVYKMKFLKYKSEQYSEEKEKIYKEKNAHKDNSGKVTITSLFKKVFRRNITLKERILSVFRDFEKITYKAHIYKSHMTATELKDKAKLRLENLAFLDEMTETYNEVKFSNFEPKENQLDLLKKAVENVKRQLFFK